MLRAEYFERTFLIFETVTAFQSLQVKYWKKIRIGANIYLYIKLSKDCVIIVICWCLTTRPRTRKDVWTEDLYFFFNIYLLFFYQKKISIIVLNIYNSTEACFRFLFLFDVKGTTIVLNRDQNETCKTVCIMQNKLNREHWITVQLKYQLKKRGNVIIDITCYTMFLMSLRSNVRGVFFWKRHHSTARVFTKVGYP